VHDPDDTACSIPLRGLTLDSLAETIDRLEGVWKRNLRWGDRVVVVTRNSVYTLRALGGDEFAVSGGWFDRTGAEDRVLRVNGCTWGGRAINEDVVAAPGLFLEFGNGVQTTRIQKVEVWRDAESTATN
jgi:hypothetical protein